MPYRTAPDHCMENKQVLQSSLFAQKTAEQSDIPRPQVNIQGALGNFAINLLKNV